MTGKTDQLAGQRQYPAQYRTVWIEAGFTEPLERRLLIAPAATTIRQGVDLIRRQAEGLGDIAHRAGAVIGAGDGGKRRPAPAIAPEYVLQHFLAPLVLEVHIDIRWLVALLGEEALEQHVHARRVDFGDAQDVAHRRVGRRAAALAEDALGAGELDDIVHSEEIALIAQLGDQPQLLLGLFAALRRDAPGPTPTHALLGQLAQPGGRRMACRHQLAGVLVTQLAEVEGAARSDAQRLGQQLRWVKLGQRLARTQMPFAIGEQPLTGVGHRAVVADGGHAVLQGATTTGMHVHIAAGHHRYAQRGGQCLQTCQALRIVRATVQFHRQPQALAKKAAQPRP
ncbi:hypothetical protein D3C85_601580 [compost metagenome]